MRCRKCCELLFINPFPAGTFGVFPILGAILGIVLPVSAGADAVSAGLEPQTQTGVPERIVYVLGSDSRGQLRGNYPLEEENLRLLEAAVVRDWYRQEAQERLGL